MYAYFIDISQGHVENIYAVVGSIIITVLQIVCRLCQWKNFEGQSIIGEDMDKSKVARFLVFCSVT